jgi:DNA (cytosine-5)-methyltransferase 1
LTSYLAGFPAKTSVQQDEAPASMEKNPACGNTWRELLGRYDPSTHSLRTAQCSLFEDLTESSPTLPRWGSMRTGELYRQPTLVRPTGETESGLWPTPRAQEPAKTTNGYGRGLKELIEGKQQIEKWPTPTSTLGTNGGLVTPTKGREGGTLIEALSARTLWPTPLASNTKAHHLRSGGRPARSYMPKAATGMTLSEYQTLRLTPTSTLDATYGLVTRVKGKEGGTLIEALIARTLWPTPTVCGNYNRKGLSANSGDGLATAVATWPTPTASDNRPRGTQNSTARRMALGKQIGLEAMVKWTTPTAHNAIEAAYPSEYLRVTPTLAAQAGGALNPDWVEWLMGWPLGWTDLRPLGMDKFQQWRQQHGVY